ncbi:hypothetical protein PENNAL_c0593G05532 [Penicillium nalgiovense]|uniref:Uncharacterized protein n=1 Tax=Penicillium nalgiovense TaxID=60175 RepID=A0A1V6VBP2_PENNA|nr:hypothetical protein PENNAL_c0593G05532 [Penicillium nalgiovense]
MFIASGFVTRVYCFNKLPCAPQSSFFGASADRDELERDVAWLVTALQRVENTLISATRVECHANKYLVCSSSPVQIRLHALYPFHMATIDDESQKPILLPASYLWLSMQPSKSSSGVGC